VYLHCTDCAMRPVRIQHVFPTLQRDEFHGRVGNKGPNYQQLYEIFRGLSQNRGRTDFSENLQASLFNDDLSNEPTFSRSISLDSTFKAICEVGLKTQALGCPCSI
jgi:hypothetical protein